MSWFDIIAIVIAYYIIIAYFVFILICEKYNLFVSFRMLPNQTINEYKEEWENFTTLEKTDFILAVFFTMLLLINLCLDFIDRYHSLFIVFCFIVYLIARSIYLHPSDIDFPKKQIKKFLAGRWKWFKSLRPLKQAYLIIAGVIAFALFILFFRLYLEILLFDWGGTGTTETTETTETTGNADSSIRNLAIAFLGTTSGIGALFGVFLAILRSEENKRQNDTAEQGLITDRINKAVESLGKINRKNTPILEVRIGALYALERIAQDSIEDHIRIMKIICAYIYVREPLTDSKDKVTAVGEDVRAALIVIGQRGKWTEDQEHLKEEDNQKYKLDLRHCNLRNAGLVNANLSKADLINATLETTHLNGAILRDADLLRTNLTNASLTGTDFENAYMGAAFAYEGDFSRCKNLTQPQLEHMYCGKGVNIINLNKPNDLTRPGHWPTKKTSYKKFYEGYEYWLKNVYPTLSKAYKKNN